MGVSIHPAVDNGIRPTVVSLEKNCCQTRGLFFFVVTNDCLYR